jgi:hypothetical protein
MDVSKGDPLSDLQLCGCWFLSFNADQARIFIAFVLAVADATALAVHSLRLVFHSTGFQPPRSCLTAEALSTWFPGFCVSSSI